MRYIVHCDTHTHTIQYQSILISRRGMSLKGWTHITTCHAYIHTYIHAWTNKRFKCENIQDRVDRMGQYYDHNGRMPVSQPSLMNIENLHNLFTHGSSQTRGVGQGVWTTAVQANKNIASLKRLSVVAMTTFPRFVWICHRKLTANILIGRALHRHKHLEKHLHKHTEGVF